MANRSRQDVLHIQDEQTYQTFMVLLRDLRADLKNVAIEEERIRRMQTELTEEKARILFAIAEVEAAVAEYEDARR